MVDKHSWNDAEIFHECAHGVLEDGRKWLEAGSVDHEALISVVINPALLRDLSDLIKFCHTGELESYHSMMLKYVPERLHFSYDSMLARTQLSVLDHNNNVGREQASTADSSLQISLEFKKAQSQWRVRKVCKHSTHNYKKNLVMKVLETRTTDDVP